LQLGFDSVHFARIDYQDRAKRKGEKSLEVIWRGSKTFGSSAQIFANTFPVHYSAPNGFNFEVSNTFDPLQVPSLKPISKILMLIFIYLICMYILFNTFYVTFYDRRMIIVYLIPISNSVSTILFMLLLSK
jgi:hypothetical protein